MVHKARMNCSVGFDAFGTGSAGHAKLRPCSFIPFPKPLILWFRHLPDKRGRAVQKLPGSAVRHGMVILAWASS